MSTSNTHQQSFADAGSETRPLMLERGTAQNKVDRETRFNNEFDQFVAKPGEALFLVYDHFSKILNDLERNHINFPHVTVNTKFLNCLQPEWPKYVTHVRLSKRLTVDSYDDLFDYLQQFEKLVNASRAKKLEKSHDPLALVAHTGSSSKTTSPYYVIHPSLVVDYDDDYQGEAVQNTFEDPLTSAMIILARAITQNFSNPTNNHLHTSSNTRNQAIVQGDRVNIQSRNSSNGGRNTRCSYVQEEIIECNNVQNDAGNIQRTLRLRLQKLLQMFNATTAVRKTVELQKTQLILKRKMIENEDAYYDTLLDLEAKVKKNVDTVLKIGYFLQGMFMLGPKPMSFYDSQLKHGLGYANPYTLKKAISQNPKLYDASCLDDSKIHMNVRDTEDILDDATKNFVPQKELSAQQKYFPSFISSENPSNESSPYSSSETKPTVKPMPSVNPILVHVRQKTYTYADEGAQNQDLLITISELQANLKNVEKARRALFTTPRTVKSMFENTTSVVSKTRFSIKTVQSKSSDTTPTASKPKIAEHMRGDRSLLKNFVEKFMGTIRFGNDHFAAITSYGDYVQGNITVCHVYYVEGVGHNLFSAGQFCDGDLEAAFRSKTCYMRNLEGDDMLTGDQESNLYTISISDMAVFLTCLSYVQSHFNKVMFMALETLTS
ncbi:hypothetical protein Tco_1046266 [Tanacetum coccineum]